MHKHGGDVYNHKNIIDFSANINFLGMPESVKQAAKDAVEKCVNYPDTSCVKLRSAIAEREQIEMEQVICGNGAAELIFSLVLAVKPRRALLLAPTFYEYEQALHTVGCKIDRYYLQESSDFCMQEDFLERIVPEMDMVVICNPNNPTGVLTEEDFLEQILRRCEKHNALLVLDECFNDFLEEPERYSMKRYVVESKHLFILKAFTKMYAMAGLRLGYGLCGEKELLAGMNQNRQPWSVSIPAQYAGVAAAKEIVFAEESRRQIQREREFLKQEMLKSGYPVIGSAANYLFFKGSKDLYEKCLKQGILIRDCSNYEGLRTGWYRIAVKSHPENLRLLEVLQQNAGK